MNGQCSLLFFSKLDALAAVTIEGLGAVVIIICADVFR